MKIDYEIYLAMIGFGLALALANALGSPAKAQTGGTARSDTTGNLPADGATLFMTYCVDCHGKDARGQGPRASTLGVKVPDLTRLAAGNGGVFPLVRVEKLLTEKTPSPITHGGVDMPVWGPVFSWGGPDAGAAQTRAHNVARYLESVQKLK